MLLRERLRSETVRTHYSQQQQLLSNNKEQRLLYIEKAILSVPRGKLTTVMHVLHLQGLQIYNVYIPRDNTYRFTSCTVPG